MSSSPVWPIRPVRGQWGLHSETWEDTGVVKGLNFDSYQVLFPLTLSKVDLTCNENIKCWHWKEGKPEHLGMVPSKINCGFLSLALCPLLHCPQGLGTAAGPRIPREALTSKHSATKKGNSHSLHTRPKSGPCGDLAHSRKDVWVSGRLYKEDPSPF